MDTGCPEESHRKKIILRISNCNRISKGLNMRMVILRLPHEQTVGSRFEKDFDRRKDVLRLPCKGTVKGITTNVSSSEPPNEEDDRA